MMKLKLCRRFNMPLAMLLVSAVAAGCSSESSVAASTGGITDAAESRGALVGRVMRGGGCAVERAGISCAPQPAAGVSLTITTTAGQRVDSVTTNSQGVFGIRLPPGRYRVEMNDLQGIEFSKDLPTTVMIDPGQEARLDVRIDTGIR